MAREPRFIGGVTRDDAIRNSTRHPVTGAPDLMEAVLQKNQSAISIKDHTKSTKRIVDWVSLIGRPLFATLFGYFGLGIGLAQINVMPPNAVLFVVATGFGALFFLSELKGVEFDLQNNELRYPFYFTRRSINLDEIRDANSENEITRNVSYAAMDGGKKQVTYSKKYHVNLSGDFETRILTFQSRYKRDQFLSYLREVFPIAALRAGVKSPIEAKANSLAPRTECQYIARPPRHARRSKQIDIQQPKLLRCGNLQNAITDLRFFSFSKFDQGIPAVVLLIVATTVLQTIQGGVE